MNGDIVTRLDFGRFIGISTSHDFDLTIAYTRFVYRSSYDVLSQDDDVVTGIVEKPAVEYSVSGGIYAMKSSVLEFVPDSAFFTMPQLIESLIRVGRRVGAYHIKEFWVGPETIENFDQAIRELNYGAVHKLEAAPT